MRIDRTILVAMASAMGLDLDDDIAVDEDILNSFIKFPPEVQHAIEQVRQTTWARALCKLSFTDSLKKTATKSAASVAGMFSLCSLLLYSRMPGSGWCKPGKWFVVRFNIVTCSIKGHCRWIRFSLVASERCVNSVRKLTTISSDFEQIDRAMRAPTSLPK